MTTSPRSDVTVLICTFNRAALLERTLKSLGRLQVPRDWQWDVLVVDNNSTDDTRRAVESMVPTFRVPLRYVYEAAPGKSSAFNRGLASGVGRVIASTDDDVVVSEEWLVAACAPLLDASTPFMYTGGPVEPLWEAQPPGWFPLDRTDLWGAVAILDYGQESFVFEDHHKVPLGANVAFRRELFDRTGTFMPTLGRAQGRTILGQELPEFLRRARAASARGLYVPSMRVRHLVPAGRLSRDYFRRWWFGKGVCRSRVDLLHPITELGLDLRQTPHVLGVPRFMYREALSDAAQWGRTFWSGDSRARVRHETRLSYFAGYWSDRWRFRHQNASQQASPSLAS